MAAASAPRPAEAAGDRGASLLRHALGIALCALSLLASGYFTLMYLERRLWLGLLSTLCLGTLVVVGAASFSRARRRLLRELGAFAAGAGDGDEGTEAGAARGDGASLLGRRARSLAALRARGGRPDLQALAARDEAELGAAAYFGRYFVAIAVLVGLLGTFAGLMETLSGVSAILREDSSGSLGGALKLLATPLAGLHVTFGASMVGILSTVSLALLQGDLGVLDGELLARLDEHTAHVLVPRLFPAGEDASALALAELRGLRQGLPQLVTQIDALAGEAAARLAALEASAEARVEEGTRACLEQVAAHAGATAESLGRHAAQLADLLDGRLRQGNEAMTAQARKVAAQVEGLVQTLGAEEEARAAARRAADAQLVEELSGAALACAAAGRDSAAQAGAEVTAAARAMLGELGAASALGLESLRREAGAVAAAQAGASAEHLARAAAAIEALRAHAEAQSAAQAKEGARQLERVAAAVDALRAGVEARAEAQAEAAAAHLGRVAAGLTAQAEALARTEAERAAALLAAEGQRQADHAALRGRLEALLEDGIAAPITAQLGAWQEAAQVARGSSAALVESAAALGEAAGRFAGATGELLPELGALAPELRALSAEVALLAARDPDGEGGLSGQLLGELCRLGDGIEQLLRRDAADPGAADHDAPVEAGPAGL